MIEPLVPPFEADVAAQLEQMMPAGVPPIALFRTFAKNLPMTKAMRPWGAYELGRIAEPLAARARDRHRPHLRAVRMRVRVGRARRVLRVEKAELTPRQITSLTSR